MTQIVDALVSVDGLVRYTAIKARLISAEGAAAGEALDKEINEVAGRTCSVHSLLEDPIIMLGTLPGETEQRLIVVCPWCSSPELLAQWEAQQL